ncbi:host attachment protein [Cupriavidus sp. AU9028]|uniref:host attachment protein n=1 Tax=Cupriavidus sp. AU9028 TaxID=2871157 RepID=UPI001C95FEA3|nr:host attachment protein [Cupriavidus sp. AU9028]MBY4898602.1 host attachment protein [Cupriavidus sp. AU9028]
MKTTWVLVADEAIARILEGKKPGEELTPVQELTHPAAHAEGTDLRRDAYGRRSGGGNDQTRQNTQHHLLGPSSVTASAGEEQQHLEAEAFARRVAEFLGESLQQRRYDELRIAAAPRFLGRLRKMLPSQVAGVVVDEVNKDLIHMQARELTDRLFPDPRAAGSNT